MNDKVAKDANDNNRFQNAILGETLTSFELSTIEDVQLAALALASQSRRCLKIFSHDLEEMIYNNEPFIRSVARVAQIHQSTFVQILVQDPVPALKSGHQLIELAHRLSSKIQIRRTGRNFQDKTKCYLLTDDVGLLVRKHWNSFNGSVKFHAGGEAPRHNHLFTRAWEEGEPEIEFRRMGL